MNSLLKLKKIEKFEFDNKFYDLKFYNSLEPDDIIWKNLGYSRKKRIFIIIINIILLVIFLVIEFCIVSLSQIFDLFLRPYLFFFYEWSFFTIIKTIRDVIFNMILMSIAKFSTPFERHTSISNERYGLASPVRRLD